MRRSSACPASGVRSNGGMVTILAGNLLDDVHGKKDFKKEIGSGKFLLELAELVWLFNFKTWIHLNFCTVRGENLSIIFIDVSFPPSPLPHNGMLTFL